MAAFRPELFTVEEVINFYDQTEGSEFNVFAGTSPNDAYRRYHFEGEKEIGMQELTAALMQISSKGENYNPYLIQIIQPGKGKAKPATFTSISFQLNRPQQFLPMQQMGGLSNRSEMLLERMIENQNVLISRISALEESDDIEDEPKQDTLGRIIENPQIQGLIMGLVDRFLISGGQPSAIAGIPEQVLAGEIHNVNLSESIQRIVKQLMDKGVTVEHLNKLNAMDALKLKGLLAML
jgi:hypothetical protein